MSVAGQLVGWPKPKHFSNGPAGAAPPSPVWKHLHSQGEGGGIAVGFNDGGGGDGICPFPATMAGGAPVVLQWPQSSRQSQSGATRRPKLGTAATLPALTRASHRQKDAAIASAFAKKRNRSVGHKGEHLLDFCACVTSHTGFQQR